MSVKKINASSYVNRLLNTFCTKEQRLHLFVGPFHRFCSLFELLIQHMFKCHRIGTRWMCFAAPFFCVNGIISYFLSVIFKFPLFK